MYISNIKYLKFIFIVVILFVLKKIFYFFSIKNKKHLNVFSNNQKKIINHFLQQKSFVLTNVLYCGKYFNNYNNFDKKNCIVVTGLSNCKKFYNFNYKPFLYIVITANQYSDWSIFVQICDNNVTEYYNSFVSNTEGKINFVLILINTKITKITTFTFNKFTRKHKTYIGYKLQRIIYYIDLINSNI